MNEDEFFNLIARAISERLQVKVEQQSISGFEFFQADADNGILVVIHEQGQIHPRQFIVEAKGVPWHRLKSKSAAKWK